MPSLYFSLTYEPWTVSSLISSECITCFNVCFITLSFRGSFNTKEEHHTRFRALEPVILKRQVSRINLALAEAEKKRDKHEKHYFWEVSLLWFISAGEGVLLLPQECGFEEEVFQTRRRLERNTFQCNLGETSMFLRQSLWESLTTETHWKSRSHTTRFSFHCTTLHCILHEHTIKTSTPPVMFLVKNDLNKRHAVKCWTRCFPPLAFFQLAQVLYFFLEMTDRKVDINLSSCISVFEWLLAKWSTDDAWAQINEAYDQTVPK